MKSKPAPHAGLALSVTAFAKSKGRDPERVAFGDNVQSARRRARLKQNELAETLGISEGALCNIEQGIYWPSLEIYRKLCVALKLGELPLFTE